MIDPAELAICHRRGHDTGLTSISEKWHKCKWCGAWIRTQRTTEEREDEPPKEDQL
jgi:hypothetical protein